MLEPRPAEEWHGIDADLFEKTIRTRGRPAVLRGFAGSWPAVQAGRESFHSLTAYLKSFYTGHPAPLFEGPASIGGRFFLPGRHHARVARPSLMRAMRN